MGIAERLTNAMSTSDLSWSDLTIKPVEFVAAMSGASDLGSDIFRSKTYDASALRRAVLLLARRAKRTGARRHLYLSMDQAKSMAVAVMFEIVHPHCRTCTGAGVSIIDDLKVTCPTCDGFTVHHFTDRERAKLCGIRREDWGKWEGRYQMVRGLALSSDCAEIQAEARLG